MPAQLKNLLTTISNLCRAFIARHVVADATGFERRRTARTPERAPPAKFPAFNPVGPHARRVGADSPDIFAGELDLLFALPVGRSLTADQYVEQSFGALRRASHANPSWN